MKPALIVQMQFIFSRKQIDSQILIIIAAVAAAVYGIYRFFAPDYLEDFEDDFEDDFDDDFFEDEEDDDKAEEPAEDKTEE